MFSNISLGETMLITVTGIIIVFLVLFLLIVIISLFGKVFKKKVPGQPEAKPVKPAVTPAAKAQKSQLDSDELIAVITAAAMCALGGDSAKFTVRSIRESGGRPVWATAGLMRNTRSF